jgi:hypothetical protein
VLAEGRFDDRSDRVSLFDSTPVSGLAGCRRDDIRRVTFGTMGKGTRAGTSWVFGSWKGERVDLETEWISLRSGRLSTVAISVGTRFEPSAWFPSRTAAIQKASSPRKPLGFSREAIAWGLDESVVLSRPGNRLRRQKPGASSSSASARFDSSFADFWFVASCVGPFAEAGARYRVALSRSGGRPERVGRKGGSERSKRWSRRRPLFAWC